jgi:triacylglycerol esterase/lipase EstA (alpha/beta hydrolase family)
MKTAMQEALEIIEDRLKTLSIVQRTESTMGAIAGYQYSKYILMELLEKEKEQIIDAYEDGYEACDMDEAMEVNKKLTSGDLYYNMNYNQNK